MKNTLRTLLTLAVLAVGFSAFANDDAALKTAIDGDHRTDKAKARDQYRNPYETLKFFGIEANMTVVEVWPGGGWYTDIIAPYLKDNGKYIAAGPAADIEGQYADYYKRARANFLKKIKDAPAVYGTNTGYSGLIIPSRVKIADDASIDMVLTFRNLHNWMPEEKLDAMFGAFFAALKPGGVLGVVEHRHDSVDQDPKAESGYMNTDYVVALAKKHGFELAAKSDVNANAKDVKGWERGVWTLPPSLSLKEKDRDKYVAIGESDRMTLKFVKPQ